MLSLNKSSHLQLFIPLASLFFLFSFSPQANANLCTELLENSSFESKLLTETTKPSGSELAFAVTLKNGTHLNLTASTQIEYERRINLPSLPEVAKSIERSTFEERPVNLENPIDLLKAILDRFEGGFVETPWSASPIRLLSLKSEHDSAHNKKLNPREKTSFESGDFTLKIQGDVLAKQQGLMSYNYYQFYYLVRLAREISTYFDTPNQGLRSRGFAMRVKSWYPHSASNLKSEEQDAPQSLFLKIPRALLKPNRRVFSFKDVWNQLTGKGWRVTPRNAWEELLFTTREEIQVELPRGLSQSEILEIARALLEKFEIDMDETELEPIVHINNLRAGLNIVKLDGNEYSITPTQVEKIGFATLDIYDAALPERPEIRSPLTYQMEFELLPEDVHHYLENPHPFYQMLRNIERVLGASENHLPKFEQALRLLEK